MEQKLSATLYKMGTNQGCLKCHLPFSVAALQTNVSWQCVADFGVAFTAIRYNKFLKLGEA
eukprot:6172373-Pleurochrysis_carterae.AAC.1